MDPGDAGWIPRLSYPKLDLHRFYRITRIATATLDVPSVSVSFYQNNSQVTSNTVSGFVEVRYNVVLGTSSNMVSEVVVFVDGQVIGRGSDTSGSAWINTTEWLNGDHQIWAIARTVDSADTTPAIEDESNSGATELGIGSSPTQPLTFDNFISQ